MVNGHVNRRLIRLKETQSKSRNVGVSYTILYMMNVVPRAFHSIYTYIFLGSKTFAKSLQIVGAKAESILYEGKTHTDLFLQVTD